VWYGIAVLTTCQLAVKGQKRQVWGHGYTELFFLDEVTALAAGHRPCFECRREAALAFQSRSAGADTAGYVVGGVSGGMVRER
jgi:hypothetical protein